ncbi:MAG TPA: phosphoribosylformylglycinamidine cyclo-ligase, partial [Phycisphaerales bacterium]|nr:phosphoribosylformylglycinamidine cyclo-ligase [Phycisphaerales bacterium]
MASRRATTTRNRKSAKNGSAGAARKSENSELGEGAKTRRGGGLTYAQSGVDIDAGDRAVELMKRAVRKTHGPRVVGDFGGFAGMFRLDYNEQLFKRNYREPVLVACTDGVGTKVKLAAEMGVFDTVGIDCVAMNVNDMIVQGAEPLIFLDYLGVWKVEPETVAAMVRGVAKGCELAGCALLGGETAEMPDVYAKGDFDIAGFAVGVVELERAVNPERVEEGDVIIGLASSGVHSNGYSLVRRIVKEANLRLDKTYKELGKRTLGEVLLEPTRIYVKSIVKMLRKYTVKKVVTGMAHITGSGLPGNVCRALPNDVDAVIDRETWDVPAIFRFLQNAGGVEEREMWDV